MMLLDAIFSHYQKICAEKEIEFDLIISGDLQGIKSIIKQSDLETLAANLLDNAIIACGFCSALKRSIVVNLSDKALSVTDNGIAFERETLRLLGERRITTHADSGGSGIGFMTIFDIARSCKASVVITESGEYKTVEVKFDGERSYSYN
jgi:signal transduction histidine kinase